MLTEMMINGGGSSEKMPYITFRVGGYTGYTASTTVSGIPKSILTNTAKVTKLSGTITAVTIYSGDSSGGIRIPVGSTADISSIINDDTYDYITFSCGSNVGNAYVKVEFL